MSSGPQDSKRKWRNFLLEPRFQLKFTVYLVAVSVVGQPRELPDLSVVLGNHSLLHAAEGELYRAALDDAADALGLPVCSVPSKRTLEEAAVGLGTTRDGLAARLAALRTELGAPWQADHKEATAAALLVLHLGV